VLDLVLELGLAVFQADPVAIHRHLVAEEADGVEGVGG
jgi:hypothetical protein